MQELIKIEQKEGIETVNARDLHEFLESKQDFTDWIKNRIEKYNFIENEDFTIILGKSTGGRPSTDYYISIDMAKDLSMVENNDKGDEARKYFRNCEKKLKDVVKKVEDNSIQEFLSESFNSKFNLITKEIRNLKRMLSGKGSPQNLKEVMSYFNVVDYSDPQKYIIVEYSGKLFLVNRENYFSVYIKEKTDENTWERDWYKIETQVGSLKKGLEYILEMY